MVNLSSICKIGCINRRALLFLVTVLYAGIFCVTTSSLLQSLVVISLSLLDF